MEKIAARVVQESEWIGGDVPRVLGMPFGHRGMDRPARVTAWVDGHVTGLTITVSLIWADSARATTRRLRAHVIDRVEHLTGLHVDHVDIDVARLPPPPRPARRMG
ncbi:hypothetical protein [Streptomyces sp. RPT161]|uniref:hypothetical protein n=1 Tax=Streptomyces sp. RPT161 TaxID=3015993 RepID=UPI0022B8D6D9|nr:hypothetical protein [Streptomyces sp. RPT161]